jgi:hypothetical protein
MINMAKQLIKESEWRVVLTIDRVRALLSPMYNQYRHLDRSLGLQQRHDRLSPQQRRKVREDLFGDARAVEVGLDRRERFRRTGEVFGTRAGEGQAPLDDGDLPVEPFTGLGDAVFESELIWRKARERDITS